MVTIFAADEKPGRVREGILGGLKAEGEVGSRNLLFFSVLDALEIEMWMCVRNKRNELDGRGRLSTFVLV
jgi:hypothetical protein